MLNRICAAILVAALFVLVGCGSASQSPPARATAFVCHHKDPGQLGECIRKELEEGHPKAIAPPTASARAQCVDISRWQPHPDFRLLARQGIVCVIVQGADNDHESNPYFDSQVRAAHAAAMKVGVYIFAEGASSTAQADALIRAARSERLRISLGAHVDAEVPSAYSRACGIASVLAKAFHIVGVYGSPGTYRGGRCTGVVWPAEWGSGRAYPLPGYPVSAVKFRQWCGTCYLAGNAGQIDRDEDLGLIALSKPAPSVHERLWAAYRRRRELLADLHRHGCFHIHGRAAYKLCPRWGHLWREVEAEIRRFHAAHVF